MVAGAHEWSIDTRRSADVDATIVTRILDAGENAWKSNLRIFLPISGSHTAQLL